MSAVADGARIPETTWRRVDATTLRREDGRLYGFAPGGALAWGIVPTSEEARGETPESLLTKMEVGMKRFEEAGVDGDLLRRQCVITPSCGMGSLSVELTEYILELLSGTSKLFRERNGF